MTSALIDPKDLTLAERNALKACALHGLRRVKNGFRVPGSSGVITLAVMAKIEAKRLVREAPAKGKLTPTPTGLGRNVLDIMSERGM